MKNKLIFVTVLFSIAVIFLSGGFYLSSKSTSPEDEKASFIVDLNEICKLNENGDIETANEKINILQEDIRKAEVQKSGANTITALCGVSVLFFITAFGYIYFAILRPFEKMKDFAEKISLGNFDVPLKYERSNYFGEFTWAFDSMRNEIVKSRASEKEAIENNKTVIATLSHDIKTPISSIRAYAEGLEANMDSTPTKRKKYLSVIMKKCDEVSRLTNDLFLHSLSDMDKLKINPEKFEICGFIKNAAQEIAAERNDLHFRNPDFTATVFADKNRIVQITENLINNARKYAKSDIYIWITQSDGNVEIHFQDYGNGIFDEDMPFIFNKFYRGKNCGNEQGSGLGLYIVKYLAEKMDGKAVLKNHSRGLEVSVILPVVK